MDPDWRETGLNYRVTDYCCSDVIQPASQQDIDKCFTSLLKYFKLFFFMTSTVIKVL